jgi:hypothetical protein
VSDADDPAIPVIRRVMRDHRRSLRLLIGARLGANSKVIKLCRLAGKRATTC